MKITRIVYSILSLTLILTSAILAVPEKERGSEVVEKNKIIVSEQGGIYLADDGNIISLYDYHGEEPFLKNLSQVTSLAKKTEIPVYLAIPPRKMDVLFSSLPDGFSTEPAEHLFSLAKDRCLESGVNYIDLLPVLSSTEDLYFATDHHWTSRGAYLAYREIISALGEHPLDETGFEIKEALSGYLGSDYNKKKEYTVSDTIELYYSEGYGRLKTTLVNHPFDSEENNEVLDGMYDLERLNSWDPYTVYFRGNNPYIKIELDGEDRETLVVIRDSFASALAPFLAEHFDIILIDPRFYPLPLSALIDETAPVALLVLENMGSFTENTIKFRY